MEIDKQTEMIKEIRDLAAIEKGEFIKASRYSNYDQSSCIINEMLNNLLYRRLRGINKEYETQLHKINTKMTEDADKYASNFYSYGHIYS